MMCAGAPAPNHAARHLEAAEPRHLDVEEDDVRLQPVDGRQRFDAVAGLADDLDAADLSEQVAELVAGQLFVVDEHGAQVHGHAVTRSGSARSGISMLAQVPSPGTLAQLQVVVRAVDRAEPFVDVAQADAVAQRVLEPLLAHPQPVVVHLDDACGRRGRAP